MRASALVRTAAVITTTLLSAALLTRPAHADDTPLPVVGPDTVTLYPGQSSFVDVLENDLSGNGHDLELCRFPNDEMYSGELTSVAVATGEMFGFDDPGSVMVAVGPRAHGTHTIDYFVCDSTHLAPATLTVEVRDVEPVDVVKVRGEKGRLAITNHNDKTVRLRYGHPRAWRTDGRVRVAPGKTVTIRVQRHAIAWYALIGGGRSKGSMMSPGIADFGTVRDIKLDGEPLPEPGGHHWAGSAVDVSAVIARWS